MKKLSNLLLLSLIPVLVSVMIGTGIKAANTGTVSANVTAQNVSLSVSPGNVTYGTLGLGTSQDTCALTQSQTVTNDGNVDENFNIKGQDSTAWTLAGSSGNDTYRHQFYTDGTCATPDGDLTTSYQNLDYTPVAPDGTTDLDLEITVPDPSSSDTQQDVSVTVQAVAN